MLVSIRDFVDVQLMRREHVRTLNLPATNSIMPTILLCMKLITWVWECWPEFMLVVVDDI